MNAVIRDICLVGVGGGIGAVLRYAIGHGMKQAIPAYAASGTLIVNVIGSLAIGYLLGTAHDAKSMSEQMRLFLVVGILGGLTTFSSLAHETVSLAHHPDSSITHSLGHLTANIVLGLGAVWVGVWLRGGLSSAE